MSPAQLLMSRELRSVLPVCRSHLKPYVVNTRQFREERTMYQNSQQKFFNKSAKNLPSIESGQQVRFKRREQWIPGKIIDKVAPRSYKVETQFDEAYRRNRKHIHISKETTFQKRPINDSESDLDDIILNQNDVENNTNTQGSQSSNCRHKETIHKENTQLPVSEKLPKPITTRSGCTVIPPKRFQDYV